MGSVNKGSYLREHAGPLDCQDTEQCRCFSMWQATAYENMGIFLVAQRILLLTNCRCFHYLWDKTDSINETALCSIIFSNSNHWYSCHTSSVLVKILISLGFFLFPEILFSVPINLHIVQDAFMRLSQQFACCASLNDGLSTPSAFSSVF